MKKTKYTAGLLFLFFAAVLHGQHIMASPLEGAWVLESTNAGDIEEADYKELIFFGNVMLSDGNSEVAYLGNFFTCTDGAIQAGNGDKWQYTLTNDTLTIVEDYSGYQMDDYYEDQADDYYGDQYVFKKNQTEIKNPLDGLWRVSGGAGYDEDSETIILCTRDIYAFTVGYICYGFRVEFKDNRIYEKGDEAEAIMEYSLREKTLNLSIEGETVVLTKIY